jgi:peroxiredoxin family protein
MGDKTTIIVHSGDMDKLYSALIIANGALSFGMDVSLYFTFWGLERLTKDGLDKGQLSKDMGESGMEMMNNRMKQANLASLGRLMQDFKDLGGKIIACEMTMEIMGITKEHLNQELIDEYGAVGTYIKEARESNINLFI